MEKTIFDTTALEKANEAMQSIAAKRAEDLEKINEELEKANAEIARYTADMDEATANMNMAAYAAAKKNLSSAETSAEMYKSRYSTIKAKEMISEADSDAVIDSVFACEKSASALYEEKAERLVRELDALTTEYCAVIADAESIMRHWTARVHKNYRHGVGTSRPQRDKSGKAVGIRVVPYAGCYLSNVVKQFVDKFDHNATPGVSRK